MIFTKLARAASLRALTLLVLLVLLLPRAAQAATDIFSGGAVSNCTYDGATKTYDCTALSTSNNITIASGYTVKLTGSIDFDFNQQLNMSGSARLQTTGSLDIGDIKPSNLNISGGTLAAGTSFKIGAQAQTIVADITAATMTIGTGSATKITGSLTATGAVNIASHVTIIGPISGSAIDTNSPVDLTGNVTATSSFSLASGSHMTGNITAPSVTIDPSSVTVNGNIAASTALSIGSGNTVNGNVSGGSLSMASSNVVINGNVTMTGDVSMGASDTINGDLVARNVTTASSDDYISGNAQVKTIELDWHARVGKTITCTGAGASGCSCVTNNSGYNSGPNAPVCGAATPSVADHIQVTHSGTALTCQPQTVTITACANAACTAPHFTGSTVVTLQPGGQSFTITGSGSGTVAQSGAGTAAISATSTGISNASTCVNTGTVIGNNACNIAFATAGLDFTVADHAAESSQTFTVRALQQGGNANACVAALANTTQSVNFKCSYTNPTSTNPSYPASVRINGTALGASANAACSAGGSNISLAFNANGQASASLQYADAGQMNLSASLTTGAVTMTGNDSFIASPSSFSVSAVGNMTLTNSTANLATSPVFAKAGDPFNVTVSAVNSAGAVTRNFGRETSPQSISTTLSLVQPLASDANATMGSAGGGSFGAVANGVITATGMTWSEVGIIALNANLGNVSSYLGASVAGPTGAGNIGRFTPHHFSTAMSSAQQMNCNAAITKPCVAPNTSTGPFYYNKQPFDVTVTALNTAGGTTRNYYGALASAVSLSAYDASTGALNPPAASAGALASTPASTGTQAGSISLAAATFTKGVSTTSNGAVSYGYLTNAAPFSIYLRATDTDNVSSLLTPNTAEALAGIVFGRLLIGNYYGGLASSMPISVSAQYYTGSVYTLNPVYQNSTGFPLNGFVTTVGCTLKGGGGATCAGLPANTTLKFSNGRGNFLMTPMAAAGSTDLKFEYGAAVPTIIYLPAAVPGRLTFGVYRAGPVVYLREVF